MNRPQLEFIATGGAPSQVDTLISVLHEADGAWVPMPVLVDRVGSYCIHSRASDARKMGVNIENRVEYSPITKKRHSSYRLLSP